MLMLFHVLEKRVYQKCFYFYEGSDTFTSLIYCFLVLLAKGFVPLVVDMKMKCRTPCRGAGYCESFCGAGGFCCKRGWGGCPNEARAVAPTHFTCIKYRKSILFVQFFSLIVNAQKVCYSYTPDVNF